MWLHRQIAQLWIGVDGRQAFACAKPIVGEVCGEPSARSPAGVLS